MSEGGAPCARDMQFGLHVQSNATVPATVVFVNGPRLTPARAFLAIAQASEGYPHPSLRSPRASVRLTRRAAPAPELTLSGRPRCPLLVEQRHHCSRSVRDVLLASEVAMRSCSRRGGSWASQVDTTRQASKSSKILPILATGSVASASRSAGSRPTGKRSSVWQQHSQQSRSRQGLPLLERRRPAALLVRLQSVKQDRLQRHRREEEDELTTSSFLMDY